METAPDFFQLTMLQIPNGSYYRHNADQALHQARTEMNDLPLVVKAEVITDHIWRPKKGRFRRFLPTTLYILSTKVPGFTFASNIDIFVDIMQ
jgi:hypothetical protein